MPHSQSVSAVHISAPRDNATVTKARIYLGVDPGLNGALAFYNPVLGTLSVADMPTKASVRNGKTKRNVDGLALGRIVDRNTRDQDVLAVVEQVGAMPGQGVTSMFTFGRGVGCIDGVLGTLLIEPVYVVPRVWQKSVGVTDKLSARLTAAAIFPAYALIFSRVKDDGRADAALLAFYASQLGANT